MKSGGMVQPFHPFFALHMEDLPMIKSFVACCVAATFASASVSTIAQDTSYNNTIDLMQQNNSLLITSAMNNIALQNTLPPERRAPGYGNTPAPRRNATTGGQFGSYTGQAPAAPILTSLKYTPQAALTRAVQSEFVSRTRKFNPEAGRLVAEKLASYNFMTVYASYADAAKIPVRDPASSMALYTAIGWSIVNGEELSGNNPDDVVRVQALRKQSLATLSQRPDIKDPTIRQRIDEEFMILTLLLDAGRLSIKNSEGPAAGAEFRNGIHALWKKQFGLDLRRVSFNENGMNPR